MQDMVSIATRFLQNRKQWLELRGTEFAETWGGSRELVQVVQCEAEMRALAWVLDVDLDLMNAPKPPEVAEDPADRVRLTGIPALGCWLMEVPANADRQFRTEFWAAFLTDEQLMQLGQACILAVVPGSRPSPGQPRREKIVRLMAPAMSAPASADCRDDELLPPIA